MDNFTSRSLAISGEKLRVPIKEQAMWEKQLVWTPDGKKSIASAENRAMIPQCSSSQPTQYNDTAIPAPKKSHETISHPVNTSL